MIAATGVETAISSDVAPPAFLRFDPPELHEGSFVVRAVATALRERRRNSRRSPLGYLYEQPPEGSADHDLTFDAGHFDETNLVWSFSGELTGILGITEALSPK